MHEQWNRPIYDRELLIPDGIAPVLCLHIRMVWELIDTAPRDGRAVQVRDPEWGVYWAKFWTRSMLTENDEPDAEHGWYEWLPDSDSDGDGADPTHWCNLAK